MDELGKALMNKKMQGLKISIEPMGDEDAVTEDSVTEPMADVEGDKTEDNFMNSANPAASIEDQAIDKMQAHGGYGEGGSMSLGKRALQAMMERKKKRV